MKNALLLAALIVAAGSASAATNLVTNGSFEIGTNNIGSFAGWTTSLGDSGTFVDSSGKTGTGFGQATDGLWSAWFGSTAASGGATISQTLATVANQRYTLSFDLANDNGGLSATNGFAVFVDGTQLFSATSMAAQGYLHDVVGFTAASAASVLSVRAFNDNGWVELDNLSVTAAVPEPATWALMLAGVAGVAAVRRRG